MTLFFQANNVKNILGKIFQKVCCQGDVTSRRRLAHYLFSVGCFNSRKEDERPSAGGQQSEDYALTCRTNRGCCRSQLVPVLSVPVPPSGTAKTLSCNFRDRVRVRATDCQLRRAPQVNELQHGGNLFP